MKTNKISIAFALTLAVLTGCQQKLPYDLANTEHGVVINISKVPGTSTTLSTDMTAGDYKVLLTIPEQQGDISMLKEAQLMAVYTDTQKNKKSAIIATGITEFPYTATLNISDVCSKLGVPAIQIGDRLELTPCVTLNSGTQINGWSELTGFNNQKFTGWVMSNGANYTYKVSYTAFAPFHKDKFQGDAVAWASLEGGNFYTADRSGTCKVTQITELPATMPVGVSETDLVGLQLQGDFLFGNVADGLGVAGGDVIKMWINTQDYTLIIPDQVIAPNAEYPGVATYDGSIRYCEGEVDTLNDALAFYAYTIWGPYTFGDAYIMLQF